MKQQGRFIRLYEKVRPLTNSQIALEPWLGLNVKISYLADRKKDKLLSLGLHLIRGEVIEQFQEKLEARELSSQIPDYCFTMSTMIKPESGVKRLYSLMERYANEEPDDWAVRAVQKWKEDSELLNQFYEGTYSKKEEADLASLPPFHVISNFRSIKSNVCLFVLGGNMTQAIYEVLSPVFFHFMR